MGRGGRRPGAGRKKSSERKPTILSSVELRSAESEAVPAEIETGVKTDGIATIAKLAEQVRFGTSEPAIIAACNEILDRGYGKPAVDIGGDAMLPFMVKPAPPSISDAMREEARKHANVAVAVLRKIRDHGHSETARVAAMKSLLARGFGTVGPARAPDEMVNRPLGKKEEAQRAADSAARGRYAIPPPPKFAGTIN